jgi:hypothetical protein
MSQALPGAFTVNASHRRGGLDATSTPIGGPDGRANYRHANAEGVASTGHPRLAHPARLQG